MTNEELIEWWEERAAIREFDGGMSRRYAERGAWYDLRRIYGKLADNVRSHCLR